MCVCVSMHACMCVCVHKDDPLRMEYLTFVNIYYVVGKVISFESKN